MTTQQRQKLEKVSEMAKQAKAAGEYQIAIGMLDAQGQPWFRVFGNDYRWRSVKVEL